MRRTTRSSNGNASAVELSTTTHLKRRNAKAADGELANTTHDRNEAEYSPNTFAIFPIKVWSPPS